MNNSNTESESFDVFLCHNSEDKAEIRCIADDLIKLGIKPWLDEREIKPGSLWQSALEEQISNIKSATVFVGESGIGPWQNIEIRTFINEFVERKCPVIPAILPSAKTTPPLPILLKSLHYVDFRVSNPDPLIQLQWGITGERPKIQTMLEGGISEAAAIQLIESRQSGKLTTKKAPQADIKTELPPILFGEGVEGVRVLNGVRQLKNCENDLDLYHLPNGVFGWVEAYKLNSPQYWIPDSPLFTPDFLVLPSTTQIGKGEKPSSTVEIHKAHDGMVRILSFVDESTCHQLQQPSRVNPIRVLLFRQYQEYRYAVSIPRDRLQWFSHRSFGDGEAVADATVT